MKKIITFLLQTILILALAACSATSTEITVSESAEQVTAGSEAVAVAVDTTNPLTVDFSTEELNPVVDAVTATIQLNGDTVTAQGTGTTVSGNVVTITAPGTYALSGTLNDGRIAVNSEQDGTVTLLLNGVNITNTTSAPIYVLSADKTVITLTEGTQNVVTDGTSYTYANAEDDEPNAAIFSKDDLTINGTGALTVNANFNHGIATNDDLKIVSGVITVNAVNDAIKGKNYIAVKDGTITLNAGGDGLQSNNAEDATKGYVLIEDGTLNITSGMDGIQAETRLTINAGNVNIVSGGGNVVNYELEESAKGLKAGADITIAGGTINIDAADDGLNSNNTVTINGGEITIASGDDGVHADTLLTMNNGGLIITRAYEGIESTTITINGGSTSIISEDDGVNGAGGVDGSGGEQGMFQGGGTAYLSINGGTLAVDTRGDGLDINGQIDMTAGTVIVNGPVENMNAAVDYDGTFNLTGGFLLAVGSSGMAMAPSTSSSQYAILYNFDAQQAAGTLLHIETNDGQEILTFAPGKSYQSVTLSSPDLTNGTTYVIYTGGSSTGTSVNGLYSGGTYAAGTQVTSFTTSGIVTTSGAAGGFGPGGGFGGPGGGGPHP